MCDEEQSPEAIFLSTRLRHDHRAPGDRRGGGPLSLMT